jgi:exosortase K
VSARRRWPLVLGALAFAWLVKRWYSQADAASLRFVLAPTAWLVGAIWRAPFYFVDGYGYLSPALRFGIVPACAGLNFLVMVVGAFCCGILPQVETGAQRLRWLAAGALAAYGVTVLANTVRIALAIGLQAWPLPIDHAQLHRIEGSLVYLAFLFGFYALAQRGVARRAA